MKIAKTELLGAGLALSALMAWNVALAQVVTPAAKPAQVAQATMGITTTIAGTAAPAQAEGALGATNAAIAGGFVALTGVAALSGLSSKATAAASGT